MDTTAPRPAPHPRDRPALAVLRDPAPVPAPEAARPEPSPIATVVPATPLQLVLDGHRGQLVILALVVHRPPTETSTRAPAHRTLRRVDPSRDAAGPPTPAAGPVHPLTARELEVLRLIAHGWPNREIARDLFVTLDTVKKHTSHILDKLGAANRTHAVARARALDLIP